jgi:hypothetical protein
MRRDASREVLKRLRTALRGPPSPVPTLADLVAVLGKWRIGPPNELTWRAAGGASRHYLEQGLLCADRKVCQGL